MAPQIVDYFNSSNKRNRARKMALLMIRLSKERKLVMPKVVVTVGRLLQRPVLIKDLIYQTKLKSRKKMSQILCTIKNSEFYLKTINMLLSSS